MARFAEVIRPARDGAHLMTTSATTQDALVRAFQADGHVAVRGLMPAEEIRAVAPTIIHHGQDKAWDKRPLAERDTYGKAFLQAFNLWKVDPAIERLVFDPRLAEWAARLLGVDGVRLYHDQALFKEPHGGATPWHQDQYYWPLDTDKTITVWLPHGRRACGGGQHDLRIGQPPRCRPARPRYLRRVPSHLR